MNETRRRAAQSAQLRQTRPARGAPPDVGKHSIRGWRWRTPARVPVEFGVVEVHVSAPGKLRRPWLAGQAMPASSPRGSALRPARSWAPPARARMDALPFYRQKALLTLHGVREKLVNSLCFGAPAGG